MVKICIDAGHYGKFNRSPAVREYYESDMTWKLHLLQKRYLEEYEGVEVITTRPNQETDKGLYERGAASRGCDLFISDHSNAVGGGVNENIDYVAVYHLSNDTTTQVDDISKDIAEKIAPVIADLMQTSQGWRVMTRTSETDHNGDGMLNDNWYGVLHGARMAGTPGLIIEHSFHTNTRMTRWLMDDSNLNWLARAEADVIAEYFGLEKIGAADEDGYTRIAGNPIATADQMQVYIKSANLNVPQTVLDMIPLYLSEGAAEGIRGDIAFAQSCLETGNFTFVGTAVTMDQNNFCGMGVLQRGMKGNSFATPQLGIRAQVQHLKAYASTDALINACIDPRFQYVVRGCAEYVEWLGQKENPDGKGWAAGAGYGGEILRILNDIIGTAAPEHNPASGPGILYKVQVGAYSRKENAEVMAAKLKAAGFDTYITKE